MQVANSFAPRDRLLARRSDAAEREHETQIKFSSSQGESGNLTCTASGGRKVTSIGSP
jgi:hypothetical protein